MINNQQLLDFIKQQLLNGTDKEAITKQLIGGGWTEQDIKEGFNAINQPIINPVINPIINPVISTSVNNPILTQTNKHLSKKILLIIIVVFLIAGGASGYYFRNDIPVIKDLIKSKAIVPINEIKQTGDTQTQIQPEQVNETIVNTTNPIANNTILSEKDCGISRDTPDPDDKLGYSYTGDPALKCFGESALNCTNAKVIITGGNTYDKNLALLQTINNNGTCLFKYTGYQNKYTQCPLNLVKELDISKSTLTSSNPIFVYKNIDTSNPEKYTASLYNSMIMMNLISNDQYQKNGCTGDLHETMSALMNKAKENIAKIMAPENEIKSILHSFIAEVAMDSNTSLEFGFKGSCSKFSQPFVDQLKKQNVGVVKCFDSKDSIAMSASLSTGGFMCFDTNNGLVEGMKSNITSPSCI